MCRIDIRYYAFFGGEKKHIEISQVTGAWHQFYFHVSIEKRVVCEIRKNEKIDEFGNKYFGWEVSNNEALTLEDIDHVTALIDYELDLIDETLTTLCGVELRRSRQTTESDWDFFVNGVPVKRWVYYSTRQDWYWSAQFNQRVEDLKIIHFPE
ncbi:hypothetical protein [Chitinophaga varians]|uniref:hypothetical protein n=1 Tax=Chitinophaga varians TaxID=2202339 RepID=UPI00165F5EC6|nr:hypothetical protein [Chitinophaga varians]MBC9913201.1 hypothetical protein [Chitinophaga varians]